MLANSHQEVTSVLWPKLLIVSITTLIAFFIGTLSGLGGYIYLAILIICIFGLSLIFWPKSALWGVVVGGTIIVGLAELYFPTFTQIRWLIAAISFFLLLLALIKLITSPTNKMHVKVGLNSTMLITSLCLFLLSTLLSVLANQLAIGSSIVGFKNYFQMFGLSIGILAFISQQNSANQLFKYLIILGIIQIPFAIQQFIQFVPLRSSVEAAQHGVVAVDVVSGTFGGAKLGGGRSANLALLSSILIVLMAAQWKFKMRSAISSIVLSLLFLLPMVFNEAKLFIVLLPIGLFLLFRENVLKNPFKVLAGAIGLAGILGLLIIGYSLLPGAKSQQLNSFDKYYREIIEYNLGNHGYGNSSLNRTTVYTFWYNENIARGNIKNAIFGYGLGSTNQSSIVSTKTLSNTKYRGYGIGLTTLSSLLWEIGLLGTLSVMAIIISAYYLAYKLQIKWINTENWPYLRTAQIAVLMFSISMLHNNYFVSDLSYQTLLMLLLGYLLTMDTFNKVNSGETN
jgi:hypothetical protein